VAENAKDTAVMFRILLHRSSRRARMIPTSAATYRKPQRNEPKDLVSRGRKFASRSRNLALRMSGSTAFR